MDIYLYSLDEFGPVKAENYYRTIETKIKLLAGQPGMGERCDNIRPGYQKFEVVSHTVFYKQQQDGIDVIRILHQSQDPLRHL